VRARTDEPKPGEIRITTTPSGTSSVNIADLVADDRYKEQVKQVKKLAKLMVSARDRREGVEANGGRTPD
jgi:hypothetical protein